MLPKSAVENYKQQQQIGARAALTARVLWRRMGDEFTASWYSIAAPLTVAVAAAQVQAAGTADKYLGSALFETGQMDTPVSDVRPESFGGLSVDGRPLDAMLYGAVITTKQAVAAGSTPTEALKHGGAWLEMAVLTAVADANREAVSAGIASRPTVTGWVRMLNPPSCSRCVILAGKWFRWNEGFQRHPRCDCRHIPSSESLAGDMTTDPYEYFRSLSEADQNKVFGKQNARAVRDGADIFRVENIRLRGLSSPRSWQAQRYGTPTRMTVDDIYRAAGHRSNAIRMLTENGYITGPQNPQGNILGFREGFGALGRGGTRVGASQAVAQARLTGVRDPLNRATMTAAERRLADAVSINETVAAGRNPWLKNRPLTDADLLLAEQVLAKQLADLPNQPRSVHELARRLGITQ